MQKIKYINNPELFLIKVQTIIKQTDVVLDIWCWIQPQKYIKPVIHICAEPYEQYAQYLLETIWNKKKFFIILKQKWDEVIKTIPKNWVDTIMSLDVIEHLEKEEWVEVLKNTIPLARKQIVIFTPYWFLPQEVPEWMKDAWGLDWADWQKHKSWWTEKDFDENWDIYICPEFHFYDAITNEKFKKPYWAMFAILNKNEKSKKNIYSLLNILTNWNKLVMIMYFFSIFLLKKLWLFEFSIRIYRIIKK